MLRRAETLIVPMTEAAGMTICQWWSGNRTAAAATTATAIHLVTQTTNTRQQAKWERVAGGAEAPLTRRGTTNY